MTKEIFNRACQSIINFEKDCDRAESILGIQLCDSFFYEYPIQLFEMMLDELSVEDHDLIIEFIYEHCFDIEKQEWHENDPIPLKLLDDNDNIIKEIASFNELYDLIYGNN